MTRGLRLAILALAAGLSTVSARAETVLARHATIWTQGPKGKLENADLLVREGKIAVQTYAAKMDPRG